jgi:hypothetical protein
LDNARKVAGSVGHTNLYNMESNYGTLDLTFQYDQTFRSSRIAQVLFGNSLVSTSTNTNNCSSNCTDDCGNTILIQGSQYNNGVRDAKAWLADYFYLPSTYQGSFTISPKIKEYILNLDFYMGLDDWMCGSYLRVYAPFVHSNWNLQFCNTVDQVSSTSAGYDIGYFGPTAIAADTLFQSFADYARGATPDLGNNVLTFNALKYAKLSNCKQTQNGLADLRVELGRNFIQDECRHFGLNVQIAAPTGSKRKAEFAFDSVVGNGKHWELGVGFSGHRLLWSSEDESKHVGFYVDGSILHMFKHNEQRTFDLVGKPNSRYMLAEKFGPNTQDLQDNNITSQFANEYTPVANLTTFDLKVSSGVQADIVLWLNYTRCNWSFDLGYDFYGRSKEKFDYKHGVCGSSCNNKTVCDISQQDTWALKGDSRVYGFVLSSPTPIALSATQSNATICTGTNAIAGSCISGSTDFYKNNCGVDNSTNAFFQVMAQALTIMPGSSSLVRTSQPPVFITCADVDFARTRYISNKVFGHINYTWDRECWIPYLGVGGFAEFGKRADCNNPCLSVNGCTSSVLFGNCKSDYPGSSVNTSISKWGVWLKGGVDFN